MNASFLNSHTACHSCDLLVARPVLNDGEKARCPRCGHLLARRIRGGHSLSFACATSALIFLVLSLLFPFLTFEAQGIVQQMTLLQSAVVLTEQGYFSLALLLTLFILLLPGLFLLLLCSVLFSLALNRHDYWTRHLVSWLYRIEPWCMVEVFLIGTLVTLIKIAGMADVVLGMSFWAYILFTLTMTGALFGLDRHTLWADLETSP